MRLIYFKAENVYGYLKFDINFFDDVTFLIGINGAGKTTVARIIHSILAPSFLNLSSIEHESVILKIEHKEKEIIIESKIFDGKIHLKTSETDSELVIPAFIMPSTESNLQYNELANAFYREKRSEFSDHEVLKYLINLPTPMLLGLERKSSVGGFGRLASSRRVGGMYRGKKGVFAGTLSDSLDDAADLAWQSYREIQAEEDKLRDKLRNSLIMRAFDFIDARPIERGVTYPSKKERNSVEQQRLSVRSTLLSLGLSEDEVGKGIDPFFERLNSIIQQLPSKSLKFNDLFEGGEEIESIEAKQATINWVVNKWQFDRIGALASLIDELVIASRKLYAPIDNFLQTVNSFLAESGKRITIDRFGMRVKIGNMKPRDLYTLSSGEQQLVVLLTHLAFNPSAKRANVLIIDEPEISLHIAWQEMFVDALIKASPTTQFILATHSPSIILDKDEHCQELN